MSIHRHGHRPEITVVREPDRAPEADLSLRRPAPGGAADHQPRHPLHRLILLPRPDVVGDQPVPASTVDHRRRRALVLGDALAALVTAVGITGVARVHDPAGVLLAMCLPAVWMMLLGWRGGYRPEPAPSGPAISEVAVAGMVFVTATAGLAFLVHAQVSRPLPPVAGAGLVLGSCLVRVMAERWVHGQRRRGRGLQRVLVIGHPEPTARLIETVDAAPGSGLVIVGAALPFDGYPHTPSLGVPVVLDEIEVAALVEMAAELSVDAVALSSDPDVSGLGGRRLHDGLADRGIALLAARSTAGAAWSPCLEEIPGTPLVRVGARAVG